VPSVLGGYSSLRLLRVLVRVRRTTEDESSRKFEDVHMSKNYSVEAFANCSKVNGWYFKNVKGAFRSEWARTVGTALKGGTS